MSVWEGPCVICHERTARYGETGRPLCRDCEVILDQARRDMPARGEVDR